MLTFGDDRMSEIGWKVDVRSAFAPLAESAPMLAVTALFNGSGLQTCVHTGRIEAMRWRRPPSSPEWQKD